MFKLESCALPHTKYCSEKSDFRQNDKCLLLSSQRFYTGPGMAAILLRWGKNGRCCGLHLKLIQSLLTFQTDNIVLLSSVE